MSIDDLKAAQELVQPIVNKLETLGMGGFELATKQVMVVGVQMAVWALISLVVIIVFGRMFLAGFKEYSRLRKQYLLYRDSDQETKRGMPYIERIDGEDLFEDYHGWTCIPALVALIPFVAFTTSAVGRFINPQWYAIEKIFSLFTGPK